MTIIHWYFLLSRQNAELKIELKRLKEMYDQLQERFTKYVAVLYYCKAYLHGEFPTII